VVQVGISPEGSPRSSFRGDIEGLRALAVLLVLVGHAGRGLVPGGFVGVDVFFVISGFLITGLLVTELERNGHISLAGFYARRAKRLLPAAGVVLVVSLLLTYFLLPKTRWSATGWDVVTSAFYGLNWRLAEQSTDYWAADQAPSVVQHFWSLGVEEQFYLVWPLLLLTLAVVGGRRQLRRGSLMVGFGLVALPSFAWSVYLSQTDPGPAYFVTTTRLWELALGGAVAIAGARMHRVPRPLAAVFAWAGLAAVVASAFLLTSDSNFPGYSALLPTVGTATVIACAVAAGRIGPAGLLGLRPARAVGAVSYSLYLWHWPLLVAAEARFGDLSMLTGLGVVALSAVPAVLTYRYVENPIRLSPALRWEPAAALRVGALCTAVAVAAGLLFQLTVWPPPQAAVSSMALPPLAAAGADATPAGPPGAAALKGPLRGNPGGAPVDRVSSIVPDPLVGGKDGPEWWPDACHAAQYGDKVDPCTYGDKDSAFTVALAGDSHAEQWRPALQRVAVAKKWRLLSYTRSACPFTNVGVAVRERPKDLDTECTDWNRALRATLTGAHKPNLLVVSNALYVTYRDGQPQTDQLHEHLADGLRSTWREMTGAGVPVSVIRDTPYQLINVSECVSANPRKLTKCATSRDAAMTRGAAPAHDQASANEHDVHLIDLTDAICPTDLCAPVIGGVLVYRDTNHLTATYVESLTPRLSTALTRLLN
jgi:peptidoglycan/LPS O-acetylase OafA/YrhL